MNTLKYISFIFSKKQKKRLISLFFVILLGSVMELLGVGLILPFINVITDPSSIEKSWYLKYIYDFFDMKSTNKMIFFLAIILIIIYIIKNIYISFMYSFQYKFIYENQGELAVRMFSCYMRQNYLFHVENNSADLMRNLNVDVIMFFKAALSALQLFTEISVCLALILFLLISDVLVTMSVIGFLLAFFLIYFKLFKTKISNHGKQTRKANSQVNKWMMQGFGGVKEAIILEKESFFIKNFEKAYKDLSEAQRKNQLMGVLPKPIMETLCVCGLLTVVIIKMQMTDNLVSVIPILTVFAVAAFRMLPSFNRISLNMTVVLYNKASVKAIYEDLVNLEKLENKIDINHSYGDTILFNNELSVEGLSFKYPNTNKYILKDVNLSIPKNKSIALVGSSGAGKTTFADIILGALQPIKGTILVDGVDILKNLSKWHNLIGYIPQNIYLMDDTLKNNIAFGVDTSEIDDIKINRAIEDAQLTEFVMNLEKGIDTLIGEGGIRISGGQRQRIGIARALYNNPDVLVLDEATSALDSETEAAVMDAINKLAGTKTLIIIAHRLSTIEKCDIVYEVKDLNISIKSPKVL